MSLAFTIEVFHGLLIILLLAEPMQVYVADTVVRSWVLQRVLEEPIGLCVVLFSPESLQVHVRELTFIGVVTALFLDKLREKFEGLRVVLRQPADSVVIEVGQVL